MNDLNRREFLSLAGVSALGLAGGLPKFTKAGGKATAGVLKDVVMVGGFQEVDIDFTAMEPGLSLFHCHQQVHMDFEFMALLNVS